MAFVLRPVAEFITNTRAVSPSGQARMRHRPLLAAILIAGSLGNSAAAETLALTVADAQVMIDDRDSGVFIRLTPRSATALAGFTRTHIRRPIAVLIDGRVRSTPFIQEPLVTGALSVGGLANRDEAIAVSKRLRSGRSALVVAPAESTGRQERAPEEEAQWCL